MILSFKVDTTTAGVVVAAFAFIVAVAGLGDIGFGLDADALHLDALAFEQS